QAQLLGEEADGNRQDGVEPVQAVVGTSAGDRRDAGEDRLVDGCGLARAKREPERARRLEAVPGPRADQRRDGVEDKGDEGQGDGGGVHGKTSLLSLSINASQGVIERPAGAPDLLPSDHLRPARGRRRHRVRRPQLRPGAQEEQGDQVQGRPVRVRAAVRDPAGLPLRDQLLPDRDALHPVRHRGRVPLPGGRAAAGVRDLRDGGDDRLHRAAARGPRLRLAARSARVEIVRREKVDKPDDFRLRQLRARDMLRGDLEGSDLEEYVQERIITTTFDKAVDWARGNSLFPATLGMACCASEMMSLVASRVDIARFGFEAFRASPRQADMLILSGRISIKMAPILRRIYDQMLEPRYAIAMGACSSSMGVFNNYAIVPGDKFMPVDVHVPGCPPRPEALVHGILKLRAAILSQADEGWRSRYGGVGTEEVVADLERREPGAVSKINVSGGVG